LYRRSRSALWLVGPVLGGVILYCLVIAWIGRDQTAAGKVSLPKNSMVQPPPAVSAAVRPSDPVARDGSARCPAQSLVIGRAGVRNMLCAGATRTQQMGGIRRHTVPVDSRREQWLRVDAVGTRIVGMWLGNGNRAEFRCTGSDCRGIMIGEPDAAGVRQITLRDVEMLSIKPGDRLSTDEIVSIEGVIRTGSETSTGLQGCDTPSLSVIGPDHVLSNFCPRGGSGLEINDDGTRTYRFSSLDGISLEIVIDDKGAILKVDYAGDKPANCTRATCAGVSVEPASPDGSQTFRLASTALTSNPDGTRFSTLTGTLVTASVE
jgi:hypothetical protein